MVYFTRELPGLSEDLSEQGFQVYEALAVSEVLYPRENVLGLTVGDYSVEPARANEVAARITLLLNKNSIILSV